MIKTLEDQMSAHRPHSTFQHSFNVVILIKKQKLNSTVTDMITGIGTYLKLNSASK